MRPYLKFRLDDQRILVDLSYVEMVIHIARLQEVPDSDPAFEGMLNYHGAAVPIYHLSKLINLENEAHYSLDMLMVLCQIDNKCFGILISETYEVIEVADNDIQQGCVNNSMPFFAGIVEDKDEAWVLDLKLLMENHEQEIKVKT